jgi:hypothetical protein
MANKKKAAKPVYANAGAVVTALVTATKSARLNVAKILHTAISGGVTAAAIARAWKESDSDGAMTADACTKYAIAYAASLAGGDFGAVLNGLNNGALKRDDVKAWATGGEIPAEYAASDDGGNGGNGGGKTPSEPLALTKKQLDAIVKRVKTGKVSSIDALAALKKAHADIMDFGVATGAVKVKETVATK